MNQGFKLKAYKGYIGTVNAEVELGYYWGVIMDTSVPIEYESDTLEDLQYEFESAVDEYMRLVGISDAIDMTKDK